MEILQGQIQTGCLKPHFQKNKDWNFLIPSLKSLPHCLKPHFQKNKDWNKLQKLRAEVYDLLKTPLPEKQGLKLSICEPSESVTVLKPHFQKNKDWNQTQNVTTMIARVLKTPLPEKQGLKLKMGTGKTRVAILKPHFQKNKDWNKIWFGDCILLPA